MLSGFPTLGLHPRLPDVDGGLWFADEGTLLDATGQNVAQNRVGVITPVMADRYGSGLTFTPGTNTSYFQVGFSGATANLGPCTILCLVKRTGTNPGIMWDRGDGNNVNAGIQFCFFSNSGIKLRASVTYASSSMVWEVAAPAVDEWHLVGMTWTGAQGAGHALYIDGVVQSPTLVAAGSGARGADNGFIAEIGGTSRTVYAGGSFDQNSLEGAIAMLLIDRRVWPEAEIKTFRDGLDDLFWVRQFWLPSARATSPPPPPSVVGPLIGGALRHGTLIRGGRLAA